MNVKSAVVTPAIVVMTLGLMVCWFGLPASSQSFEEWSRQREKAFQQYRSEREEKFLEYLQQRWEQMRVFSGQREDTVPKPDVFPSAPSDSEPARKKLEPVRKKPDKPSPDPTPEPPAEESEEPTPGPTDQPEPSASPTAPASSTEPPAPSEPSEPPGPTEPDEPEIPEQPEQTGQSAQPSEPSAKPRTFTVNFYGRSPEVASAGSIRGLELESKNSDGLKSFWSDFSGRKTGPLVEDLEEIKQSLQMDGWAYLQFVQAFTATLYDDRATATAASWALLLKSGYRARIGYGEGSVALLVQTSTPLYEVPYFTLDNQRFYLVRTEDRNSGPRSLTTYRNPYPGDQQPLDLDLSSPPRLKPRPVPKQLTFDFNDRDVILNFRLDERVVEYYSTLPQVSLREYFTSIRHLETSSNLLDVLDRKLEDVPPAQRLEFLLRFVQKSLEYKTDDEQFGEENFLLPTETLHYPYSDCEDRALLFSKLVDHLLDQRIIGLDYPGHVATAVRVQDQPSGYHLTFERDDYMVADPTYVNARPGMVMPRYRNKNPSVIPTWIQRRASRADPF